MDILIDFDGTCVTHAYPEVGRKIGAERVLKALIKNGHNLILFTMRSDVGFDYSTHYLLHAVQWFHDNGIKLYGIQTNPTQKEWTDSPKAYGQLMIDDSALGCPLIFPEEGRPYVDWVKVEDILREKRIL